MVSEQHATPEPSNPYDALMALAREGLGSVVPAVIQHLTELEGRVSDMEGTGSDDVRGDFEAFKAQIQSDLGMVKSQVNGILSAITVKEADRPTVLPAPPAPLQPQA